MRCGGQTVAAWEDLADHLAYCWVLPCSAALQYCGTASPVVAGRASSISLMLKSHDESGRQTFSSWVIAVTSFSARPISCLSLCNTGGGMRFSSISSEGWGIPGG